MLRRSFMKLVIAMGAIPLMLLTKLKSTFATKFLVRESADDFTFSGSYFHDSARWDVYTKPEPPVRKLWVVYPSDYRRIEAIEPKEIAIEMVREEREDGKSVKLSTRPLPGQLIFGIERPLQTKGDQSSEERQGRVLLDFEPQRISGVTSGDSSTWPVYFRLFYTPERIEHKKES